MRTDLLKDAARSTSRIVVKLGTGVLTDAKKQPDLAQMEQLVAQVASRGQSRDEIGPAKRAEMLAFARLADVRPVELPLKHAMVDNVSW